MFVHHVFFWLHDPENKADLQLLLDGLNRLRSVGSIRTSHIGRPADTDRDVVDASYAVSWLTFFEDAAAHEAYQKDPIHLDFVETCARVWRKVVVYDSIDA